MTISFVRAYTCVSTTLSSCLTRSVAGAASFTIYTRTKEYFRDNHMLSRNRMLDVSATGGIGYVMFVSVDWFAL